MAYKETAEAILQAVGGEKILLVQLTAWQDLDWFYQMNQRWMMIR